MSAELLYSFTPPTVDQSGMGDGDNTRLLIRYKLTRGITVLQNADGTFTQTQYPSLYQIEAATQVYLGGYTYWITGPQAEALAQAGYGAYILDPYPASYYSTY